MRRMNVKKIIPLICAVCIPFLCGCKSREIRNVLEQMMREEVILPDNMTRIQKGKVDTVKTVTTKPTLIIWIDSLQCSSCRVNQLHRYYELYEKAKKDATFEMLILFSPVKRDILYLTHMLLVRNFSFPVYIDSNNDFPLFNTIPDAPEYHSFLLDRGRKPIYVGDPTINNKLWSLFCTVVERETIETINNQTN